MSAPVSSRRPVVRGPRGTAGFIVRPLWGAQTTTGPAHERGSGRGTDVPLPARRTDAHPLVSSGPQGPGPEVSSLSHPALIPGREEALRVAIAAVVASCLAFAAFAPVLAGSTGAPSGALVPGVALQAPASHAPGAQVPASVSAIFIKLVCPSYSDVPANRSPQNQDATGGHWAELNTVTIAFGHGIAVAPLQAVMGIDALVNGGYLIPPTFLKRTEQEAMALAKRVVKPETSEKMRFLMRLNAEVGTAKKADVRGYYIGGKTGTAEKVINGHYAKKRVLNAFTAILPADNPRYQVLIMLDEPQPLKETFGFITSGWNAVPTGGNVIARIAPLLGVEPRFDLPPSDRLILAASRAN